MNLDDTLYIWETNRQWMLNLLESHSLEQLNKIPTGCNNNLIWQVGHSVVTQQRILYMATKLPSNVSSELMNKYKPGTKPDGNASQAEVDEIKKLATSLITQAKQDIADGQFVNEPNFTTTTGFHINSLQRAFEFNNYHEGLHLGMMVILQRLL